MLLHKVVAKAYEIGVLAPSVDTDIDDMLDMFDIAEFDDINNKTKSSAANYVENEVVNFKTNKNMAANSGTIVDALEHAKEKYPNDLEMQGKYLLVCLSLIRRDYGDSVKSIQAPYLHYNAILTAFPSEGMVWCVWELYSGASQEGVGLERLTPNTNEVSLLFSSNPSITRPIIPNLMA